MTVLTPATEQLDELVRGVQGVDALYPAGSIVENALLTAAREMAHRPLAASMVATEQRADGLRVTAKIGIGAAESSGDVCRRVHDAIDAQLRQSGNSPIAQIAVIVARIG
ncbi:hypothetical protein [Cryobacterium sp. Hz9]|uniref:hypothetical protein n=1 Tax=Cryobacterium sp. Hz9 TaxID=1259167 RepID=UPI00106A2673|nr:hypothetical protein [Cryobacterium sp. Hz9]TFB65648.1 hypothetical protein E3N85_11155 [Cryobacterium sp. Hz9]